MLLKTGDNRAVIKGFCAEMEKTADEKVKIFNPKQKINEYIAATADNGFNLEEVLNPGTLHLEDLCKELGLLEETEL